MEKKVFTRTIELKYHQVLLIKVSSDDEEAGFAVRATTSVYNPESGEHKLVSINMGFKEESHRDDAFSSIGMKDATQMVQNMMLTLGIDEDPYAAPEESKIII